MPRLTVEDGTIKGPKDEKVPVKILRAESIDGIDVAVMIPATTAKQLAEYLEATPEVDQAENTEAEDE